MLLLKVSYLIVDEAEEDLEMEDDPFYKEELPAVLEEEECLKRNALRESKISIALSNASGLALEIGSTQCLAKQGTITEVNESGAVSHSDMPDDTSHEVTLSIEEEAKGTNEKGVVDKPIYFDKTAQEGSQTSQNVELTYLE